MKPSSRLLGAAGFTLAYLIASPILLAQGTEVAPPTNVWAAQTELKTITLVWTRQPRAEGYRVYPVGSTPSRGIPTGELAKNVDRVVFPVVARFTGGYSYEVAAVYPRGLVSKKIQSNVVVPVAEKPPGDISAPGWVTATQTGPGIITVTWSHVSGATAYVIARAVTPPGGLGKLCELCSTATKYIDRKVTAGAKHRYGVLALTPMGATKRTMSNEVTPTGGNGPGPVASEDSTPPEPPRDVKAVATSGHSVALSWKRGRGATGYQVTRRINSGEATVLVPTTKKTRHEDMVSVSAKGALSYGVTSLSSVGRSEEVRVFLGDQRDSTGVGPPKGAIGLKAGMMSSNSVLLSWSGLLGGHSYFLSRRVGPAAPSIIATITSEISSFVDHLPSGIRDQIGYVIEEVNGKDSSHEALLTIRSVTIDSAKTRSDSASLLPKAPSNLKAAIIGPNTIRLEWNLTALAPALEVVSPAIRVINIYRRIVGGAFTLIGSVAPAVSSFIDHLQPGLAAAGVTYALESVNETGASKQVTISIDPNKARSDSAGMGPKAPSHLKATVVSPTSVQLTYNTSPGATLIRILRGVFGGPLQVVATVQGTANSFLDVFPAGTLAGGITYSIEALNGKGVSDQVSVSIDPEKASSVDSSKNVSSNVSPPAGDTPVATNPKARAMPDGSVSLIWGEAKGATDYRIERSLDGGSFETVVTLAGTVFEYLDRLEGLLELHPVYRIIAVSPKGASQPVRFLGVLQRADSLDLPKGRGK